MASSADVRTAPVRGGARRAALAGYRWLLALFLVAGGVQIFLAGFGAFSLDTGRAAQGSSAFSVHVGLGFGMAGASVVILILALIARPATLAMWLAGLLVVQTCLLQSLLDGLADSASAFGGLHALDGLLIVASAGVLLALARRPRPEGPRDDRHRG
jgi:hypothetical protein